MMRCRYVAMMGTHQPVMVVGTMGVMFSISVVTTVFYEGLCLIGFLWHTPCEQGR